jgi:hypothetical protein
MPMHDWTRVDAGIYDDFHHEWISEVKRALNRGFLPADYYALAEQVAAGFGPDVLTLQDLTVATDYNGGRVATQPRPKTTYYTELPGEFQQRKKSMVAVRHVSGDHIDAIFEIETGIHGNLASNCGESRCTRLPPRTRQPLTAPSSHRLSHERRRTVAAGV